MWRRSKHRHDFAEQRIGGGLVRGVCGECGRVRLGRNAWPILRWMTRREPPRLFAGLRSTLFSVPPPVDPPRFGERRR